MQFLVLSGSPNEVGRATGTVLKKLIDPELLGRAPVQKERVAAFSRVLAEIAPWWLEEAHGLAAAAGLRPENFLMHNCLPRKPNRYYLGNCTSALVMADRSKPGYPLLLKIRDEKPLPQVAGIKHVNGVYRYVFGTNPDNLGIAHFCNEKGLAGACNTGSPFIGEAPDPGLDDTHILRLVAEKAADCRHALNIIQTVIEGGFCGSAAYRRGMIFLFADVSGRGLLVENTGREVSHRFVKKGIHVYANHFRLTEMRRATDRRRQGEIPMQSSRIRYRRCRELLEKGGRRLGVKDLIRCSRDTRNEPYSLCNGSDTFPWRTVSAFVHELNPQRLRSWCCNGLPTSTPYKRVYQRLQARQQT